MNTNLVVESIKRLTFALDRNKKTKDSFSKASYFYSNPLWVIRLHILDQYKLSFEDHCRSNSIGKRYFGPSVQEIRSDAVMMEEKMRLYCEGEIEIWLREDRKKLELAEKDELISASVKLGSHSTKDANDRYTKARSEIVENMLREIEVVVEVAIENLREETNILSEVTIQTTQTIQAKLDIVERRIKNIQDAIQNRINSLFFFLPGDYEFIAYDDVDKMKMKTSGVYIVLDKRDGKLLYIGQSMDVRRRIWSHHKTTLSKVEYYIAIIEIENKRKRLDTEKKLISLLRPRLNKQHNNSCGQ